MPVKIVDFISDPLIVWSRLEHYSGHKAYDIGANGGLVSNILAKRFHQVVAFEPAEESFNYLKHNVPKNVTPSQIAISDKDGLICLDVRENSIGMGELTSGNELPDWGRKTSVREVNANTLDTASRFYGIPDFIKIDTEGHELAVIRGGYETLLEFRPKLFIEVHSEDNGKEIRDLLDPYYAFEDVRHPLYHKDSHEYRNHFWLIG